ncbi:MAG: A/G-specific adenine glycosylase [Paludibacter sp.]|nr:A/G-specific adenine glycosylase [Paludibacter sp.]
MDNLIVENEIPDILIKWYNQNKRELPWRNINDPYKIWISEIILQQTRVIQGRNYYLRFIERFPSVKQLAEAEEDEVLKYWQGLGYYSRARNLHKAANQIMTQYDGNFPKDYSNVLTLSGVGVYTAAAICSFAYNQPYAVLDGNVYRVLSRLFGIETPIDSGAGKKEFQKIAGKLLSIENPAEYNQAIMEFGALQCVPSSPNCENCPLISMCKAFELQLVNVLPVKSKKTTVTHRFFNYIFIQYNETTFLQKRTAKDVWQNLYEFPLIETDKLLTVTELFQNENFNSLFRDVNEIDIVQITNPMKHVLSHRVINAQFISVSISGLNEKFKSLIQLEKSEIDKYPVSRLMEIFLENDMN